MKTYTDIEQSKKLAEILPLESADMHYNPYLNDEDWYDIPNFGEADLKFNELPCWSLAALLSVLSCPDLTQSSDGGWFVRAWYKNHPPYSVSGVVPVDACVKLILKLHELNLL